MDRDYDKPEPLRAEVEAWRGLSVLEFGTSWCGYCQAAQPLIATALTGQDDVHHVKVGDGPGRPLGRSFRVKLWPTLVFLKDGREITRVVRPETSKEIAEALDSLQNADA